MRHSTECRLLAYAPHFPHIALALVAVRMEKEKTTSLGSQVPQPISAVGIRFHQHTRPSSNILTFCSSGDHRHQSSRSLPPTANLPWPHVATGSPRGVVPIRKFVRSIIHHDAQLPGAVWCRLLHAPHPSMYLIQVLATRGHWHLCSRLGYPVRATT